MTTLPTWLKDRLKDKIDIYQSNPIRTIVSGILAGIFIGLGSLFMSMLKQQGFNSLIFSAGFAIGLFAIVVIGCDLFTGNCCLFLLYFSEKSSSCCEKIHNVLSINWLTNFIGILIVVGLTYLCGFDVSTMNEIAIKKCSIPAWQLWGFSIGCNFLVCTAVYMANFVKKDVRVFDKFIAVLLPVTMFIFCGFEHSIANMYFLSIGAISGSVHVFIAFLQIVIVTMGNYFGGMIFSLLMSYKLKGI